MARRVVGWISGFVFAAAFYLLLIDSVDTPEVIVGAVAAALAATGFELAREQRIVTEAVRLGWLARAYRPLIRVPADVALLTVAALAQLVRPQPVRGGFRTLPFRAGTDEQLESGRRAFAEAFGSFAPNTIVIGIDGDRERIVAHQLRPRDASIDSLGIG